MEFLQDALIGRPTPRPLLLTPGGISARCSSAENDRECRLLVIGAERQQTLAPRAVRGRSQSLVDAYQTDLPALLRFRNSVQPLGRASFSSPPGPASASPAYEQEQTATASAWSARLQLNLSENA